MDSEFLTVAKLASSSPSPSSSSSLTSSPPPSPLLFAGPGKAVVVSHSPSVPPYTSPSSSAFSPSPLINPSVPFSRTVRFAVEDYHTVSSVQDQARRKPQSFISPSSSTPPPLSSSPPTPSSPHHVSTSSSAFVSASGSPFVSASASPFISPPVLSSTGSTPGAIKTPPPELEEEEEEEEVLAHPEKESILYDPSRDAVHHKSSSVDSTKTSLPNTTQQDKQCQPQDSELPQANSVVSSAGSSAPPLPASGSSVSPSSSSRPRTCDVYIGLHGQSSSLSRFSKWIRAELELQGIACFLADRARYSDSRSHDIARSIINSCTFGVVIISKKSFRNLYSVEEIQSFLRRKNLVPLYFDLAPSDCLARDIVEKRAEVWEKDGGELWRVYGGDEREWTEALDGLARIEEWKLEAYNGNWRSCILRAVSLLGIRLGRRSIADRERIRKERVESEEFPFPRNPRFVGRERELKFLEAMLLNSNQDSCNVEFQRLRENGRYFFRSAERYSRNSRQSAMVARRRSDADSWHRHPEDEIMEWVARRKSDSDRMQNNSEDRFLFRLQGRNLTHRRKDKCCESGFEESPGEAECSKSRNHYRFRDGQRSNRRTSRHRQNYPPFKEVQNLDIDVPVERGGIACITGPSGIGKTEMVLEYAYRHSQWYRMVLWVGGETRYLRQNYLNLSLFLGLDVGTESQVCPERGTVRSFDEQESEAFQRVKRELQRDVPYLLVIDNLESERDWWDGREISELIPRIGGATHVIFTTRLPKVMNIKSLELSYLSGVEALSLMSSKRELPSHELIALREIEEKLGRLTIGLGIVGTLLSEFPIMPSELLESINKSIVREWTWGAKEEATLKNNPFLVKLLGVCFTFMNQKDGAKSLALRMAWVGGWFAPFPVPVSLLVLAASKYSERSGGMKALRRFGSAFFCCCATAQLKRWESEAGVLLLKHGIARKCTRQGYVHFHEIVQLYARKRGGVHAAKAMVQGIRKTGSASLNPEHFWAACFLVLGFGNDPVFVELKVAELVSFIKDGVLQLADRLFTTFSRCHAALELLRLCTNLLDDVEKSFVSQAPDKSLCWKRNGDSGQQVDEYVWQDVTLLKASLLDMRSKLMIRGGQFDAAEEICRTCISIRTVMLGQDHRDTQSTQETLGSLVRLRTSS